MVEARRKLVDDRTAHTNQLTDWLKLYFPQMLNWVAEIDSPLAGALLEQWPTLEQMQKAGPEKLCIRS